MALEEKSELEQVIERRLARAKNMVAGQAERPMAETPRWASPEMPQATPFEYAPGAPQQLERRWLEPTYPETTLPEAKFPAVQEPETQSWWKAPVEKIGAGFEWIQEELERPWASIITAPFSPSLPQLSGESWLEREKREYEAWVAPKFVKGLAEFSMPLWWLPYFGWAAKGAGLIPRIGGALTKGIRGAEAAMALPITLPLKGVGKVAVKIVKMPVLQKMRQDVFRADTFRALSNKLSKLPGYKTAMGVVNPSAVAHTEAEIGRTIHGGMREVADNAVNAIMPQLERHGNPQTLFGLDDALRSTTIVPKKAGAPTNWWDIASNPVAYNLTPPQRAYIKDYHSIIDKVVVHAEELGVKIPKMEIMEGMHYVPRVWKGKVGILDSKTKIWRPLGTAQEPEKWVQLLQKGEKLVEVPLRTRIPGARVGAKAFFELPRYYEFAEEALAKGLVGISPNETMNIYLTGMYRRMADTVVGDSLKPLGKTIGEFLSGATREQAGEIARKYAGLSRLDRWVTVLRQVKPRAKRGEYLPPSLQKMIKRVDPQYAEKLNQAMALPLKKERDAALGALGKEVMIAKQVAFRDLQGIRSIARRELAAVRGGVPGWRGVGQPFAAGRLFPEEIANGLNKMLQDKGMPIIGKLSDVNALSRFMVTGFDFGAGLIQGVPLLMSNPIKWGKSMGLSVETFFNPTVRASYLSRPENLAVMQKLVPEGLLIGNSEFMQAIGGRYMRPIEAIDKLNIAQRFASSFNTFGDIARIEWAKGLMPMAERGGKSLKELTAFINEATGVMSSRALGVGATQRELEGAMFLFAPRYFRANMAFWTDMTRGGLRGTLARDTLASMMMGGFFWYYGLCKTLGQEPNLNPTSGKFMTVKIGNQHIGLGSMQVAMFRLLGNIYETATEDPGGFVKLNSRDNPLMQFARSRVAPITGAAWDVLTGRSFIGEPLDTVPSFTKNVLGDRLLPFWLSGYISDDPKPEWLAGLGEVVGLRTWPLQLWERRDELREQLAQGDFAKPWYSTKEKQGINEAQKAQLEEKYDELRRITEAARAQRLERGGAKEEVWHAYQEDRGRARADYEQRLRKAQDAFDKGQIIGYDFRLLAKEAGARLRGAYRSIESNPTYAEIIEYFAQPMTAEQMRDTPIEDIAFDQYMALMYGGDLEDEAGQYNFPEAERRKVIFIAQYGEEMLDYVRQRLETGGDIPPLMQEYYKATEILRPYWQVREEVESIFGKPQTPYQERKLNRIIGRVRERMRKANPEIATYYALFYQR